MIRALHRPEAADEHLLYLWVGGITNVALAHGKTCLFTRTGGGGLETMAVELAERRRLTLVHARQWLEHVGLEQPIEELPGDADIVEEARDILNDGVRRIANEVRSSLDFQASYGNAGTVGEVVLTGPATAVPGFAHSLEGALAIPVRVAVIDHVPPGVDPRRLTVAAGLALEEAPA
jgi:type IV pilus assembly protein PilM